MTKSRKLSRNHKKIHGMDLLRHTLFATSQDSLQLSAEDKRQAVEILLHIEKSHYASVEQAWHKNPLCMFAEVIDEGGNKTTPLKRALYGLDTFMWRPFLEWIQDYQPNLLPVFIKQNSEQKKHIQTERFCNDLDKFDKQVENDKLTYDEMCRVSLNLCKKQRKYLSWNMLREMFRDDIDGWDYVPLFDHESAPEGGSVNSGISDEVISLDSEEFDANYGNGFFVCSGVVGMVCAEELGGQAGDCGQLRGDADALRHLHAVRLADLKIIPTLDQLEENKVGIKIQKGV